MMQRRHLPHGTVPDLIIPGPGSPAAGRGSHTVGDRTKMYVTKSVWFDYPPPWLEQPNKPMISDDKEPHAVSLVAEASRQLHA